MDTTTVQDGEYHLTTLDERNRIEQPKGPEESKFKEKLQQHVTGKGKAIPKELHGELKSPPVIVGA